MNLISVSDIGLARLNTGIWRNAVELCTFAHIPCLGHETRAYLHSLDTQPSLHSHQLDTSAPHSAIRPQSWPIWLVISEHSSSQAAASTILMIMQQRKECKIRTRPPCSMHRVQCRKSQHMQSMPVGVLLFTRMPKERLAVAQDPLQKIQDLPLHKKRSTSSRWHLPSRRPEQAAPGVD